MEKKGMSPLMSTILLLVISILIGIAVMTWGRSYVEQAAVNVASANPVQKEIPVTVLQDLQGRLDRGEITQEQYSKIKEVLIQSK
jgi:uncharacterized membrane protein